MKNLSILKPIVASLAALLLLSGCGKLKYDCGIAGEIAAEIREDRELLKELHTLDVFESSGGRVVLTGTATSEDAMTKAVMIAESIVGKSNIDNKIGTSQQAVNQPLGKITGHCMISW